MILHWYDNTYTGAIAVRGVDYAALYDEELTEIVTIINIYGREWEHISIEGGEWSSPEAIPTMEDHLRADIDFLTMENESLTAESEQARADIDYLLQRRNNETQRTF